MEVIQSNGVYSYRPLEEESAKIVSEWMSENHIVHPVPRKELHSTVIFSTTPIVDYIPDDKQVVIKPATYRIQMLGSALVLSFKSTELQEAWETAKSLGATFRFPRYAPHITLSYQVPIDFELDDMKPLCVPLMLMPEIIGPSIDNWSIGMGLRQSNADINIHHREINYECLGITF